MKRSICYMLAAVLLIGAMIALPACDEGGDGLVTIPQEDTATDHTHVTHASTPVGTADAGADSSTDDSADDSADDGASKAPDFTVIDGEGNEVSLSDLIGQPVVLNFWASWCPPCKAEMPDFEEAFKKYNGKVAFMMVNLTDGSQETVDTAKAHITSCGYTFPVYFDTASEAAYAYYISSIPQTYFIDAEGNLVAYASGMIDADSLERGIGMILGE